MCTQPNVVIPASGCGLLRLCGCQHNQSRESLGLRRVRCLLLILWSSGAGESKGDESKSGNNGGGGGGSPAKNSKVLFIPPCCDSLSNWVSLRSHGAALNYLPSQAMIELEKASRKQAAELEQLRSEKKAWLAGVSQS